jgi:hypothetical protein
VFVVKPLVPSLFVVKNVCEHLLACQYHSSARKPVQISIKLYVTIFGH